jgi:hypothetical protein
MLSQSRLAQPSIAGETGSSSRLSERIERSEIASCASAGFPEKRRESGPESQIQARTSHRVPFSLGTFSWASKRKYLAREGRKPSFNAAQKEKTHPGSVGLHCVQPNLQPE